MNIIFLDVDGVLNSIKKLKDMHNKYKRPYSGYDYPFDEKCLSNLKDLVLETNSYLVITSTWRKDEIGKTILLSELKKYGLDSRVIGYTDILHEPRGKEINAYLDQLDKKVNYVILDDDNDFEELEEFLIQTDFEVGLTEKDKEEAVKKLLKK